MQNPEITDYLKDIVKPRIQRMVSLIGLIKTTYPDAVESMKYKMPTYTQGDDWVALAKNQKKITRPDELIASQHFCLSKEQLRYCIY